MPELPVPRAMSQPEKQCFPRRIGYVLSSRAGPPPAATPIGGSLIFRYARACGAFRAVVRGGRDRRLDGQAA
jgi:hypothetical protein